MEAQEGGDRVGHMSKIYLNFALGKAYEDKNLFDKAFSYYERGNKNKRIQSRYVSDDLTKEFHAQNVVISGGVCSFQPRKFPTKCEEKFD